MKYIKNLVNFILEKFFKVNRAKLVKAKNIMVNSKDFNIENLKLGNTFKVNEDVFVQDFSSKITNENLTIIVVDKKGHTKGYINQKQLDSFLNI